MPSTAAAWTRSASSCWTGSTGWRRETAGGASSRPLPARRSRGVGSTRHIGGTISADLFSLRAAIASLEAEGFNVFLEIGPHPILDSYLRECLKAAGGQGVSITTLRRHEPERDALWLALGRCYAAGVAIDYNALDPGEGAFVPLPAYPWQRERYWFSENEGEVGASLSRRKHPLLGKRLATTDGTWKNRLDPALLSWLADHVVQDSMVLPGTAYIEMAVSAVLSTHACNGVEIEGFEIRRPVLIAAGAMPLVEVGLSSRGRHLSFAQR